MEFARLKPGPGFLLKNSLLYYSQRFLTMPWLRDVVVSGLRKQIRRKQGEFRFDEQQNPSTHATLGSIVKEGYAPLGKLLETSCIAQIHDFIQDKPLHDRVQGARQYTLNRVPADARIADYELRDVIACPHILALANRPDLLSLAARYLGCKPTISAIGMRWSFPGDAVNSTLQAYHRDYDDWRFLKVFLYLTDVEADAGPHVYVQRSHTQKAVIEKKPYQDAYIKRQFGADRIVTVTGAAGFGFVADTYGIHKGEIPTGRARLMLQIQYSILPNWLYRYRPLPYSGTALFDPYVNRLIVSCQS